jgi:hypothetical protein
MIEAELLAVPRLEREQARRDALIVALCVGSAVVAGFLAGTLAESNKLAGLAALVALLFPVVAWRRMPVAVACLALLALVVEQYPIGVSSGDLTDRIPLFTSLSDYFKLSGVYVNPMEILLATVVLVMVAKSSQVRVRAPRTPLAAGLAALLGVTLAAAVHGVAAGGDYKMALWEIRPTVYIAGMYFLATQLPARIETVWATLWVFVAGVGFKALQGLLLAPRYFTGIRPDYLLSHEDSLLFALFIVLVAALWLFRQRGRLRAVATALLPLVLFVNLLNNRRTSWAILGAAVVVLAVMAWIRLPDRRRLIAGVGVAVALLGAVYLPLEWNKTGLLAGPAEAVRSQFTPDAREDLSDRYRQQEDANLVLNIKRSPLIGLGYGIPIDYKLPMLADLTRNNPFLKYIPHDDVLWVWMRLGAAGALVFWSVIGLACVSACRLLRAEDPRLAMFGAFVVCALIGYVILGNLDLGFFWFRVAIPIGWLLGVLEVAHRVRAQETAAAEEPHPRSRAAAPGAEAPLLARRDAPLTRPEGD